MKFLLYLTLFGYGLSSVFYNLHLIQPKTIFLKAGRLSLWLGFIFHLFELIYLQISTPPGVGISGVGLFSLFGWIMVLCMILINLKIPIRVLGCFISPIAFLMTLLGLPQGQHWFFGDYPEMVQRIEPLSSPWFPVHVLGALVGEVLFVITAILAVMFLIQEQQLKSKQMGTLFHRLPSLQSLDHLIDRALKWGFTFLTIGLLAGMIWAHSVYRAQWVLDPKQFWAFATWGVYACMIILRGQFHISGKKGAIFAVLGSIFVFFTLLGTNIFYGNSHSFWVIS